MSVTRAEGEKTGDARWVDRWGEHAQVGEAGEHGQRRSWRSEERELTKEAQGEGEWEDRQDEGEASRTKTILQQGRHRKSEE